MKEVLHTAKEAELIEELHLLIRVRHPNLCLFMGLAMPTPDKLYLVSEHMSRGNLYTVLHDKSQKLDWRRRISMALDAARAMNYLHCSKPLILHRNLNSINLLVDKELVTKVCDYALDTIRTSAKKSGVYTQPLWVAPELLSNSKKTPKATRASDVYSYGIILWEIVTRRTPYQGMIKSHAGPSGIAGAAAATLKAIQDIIAGMRPIIPDRCPPRMADLIRRCWHSDPNARPDFQTICDELSEMEREKSAVVDGINLWLKNQTDLEEIAIARDQEIEHESLEALLHGPEKKSWMISSAEIKLEEIIGRGSFGEVWVGTFRGKKVAIKKLNEPATNNIIVRGSAALLSGGGSSGSNVANTSVLKDFIRELNLMCSLRHPCCVLFMGACLEEGHYSLVMEYCAKGTLYSTIHDRTIPIDYNMILKTLIEIAEGVLYLHLHKPKPILHRDLKSLNILVDEDWNVKVADFGLTDFKPDAASLLSAAEGAAGSSSAAAQQSLLQVGTPFWQSPESMERNEYSEASDTYSFGMIIFELFTREIPFQSMSPHQAALAVIAEDKRPDIPSFVPPKFAALMRDCWLRDPRCRPTLPQVLERLGVLRKEGLPRIELSLGVARLYRKKTLVFAYKSKDAVIVYKPWGTGEGKKGDWVLVGPGDDVYTCDAAIFIKTYSPVESSDGGPHLYRKTGSIFALEMDRDFLMETLEGMEHGSKGDWIAQNPVDGEQWPIASKSFTSMYEIAPDQTLPAGAMTKAQARASTKGGFGSPLVVLHEEEKETSENRLTQRRKG